MYIVREGEILHLLGELTFNLVSDWYTYLDMLNSLMKKIAVVLDTNIFLHYIELTAIPWQKLIEAENIELLLIPPVTEELDRQKWEKTGKLRERAENATKKFFEWFGESDIYSLSSSLTVRNIFVHDISLSLNGLNSDEADNKIIAYANLLSNEDCYSDIYLLSNDFGMNQKAKQRNIKCIRLDSTYKLPHHQSSIEKENSQLRKELLEFQNRKPKLQIFFGNNQTHFSKKISSVPEYTKTDIEQILADIKNSIPYLSEETHHKEKTNKPLRNVNIFGNLMTPSSESILDYNKKLDTYYSEYIAYKKEKRTLESIAAKSIRFKFLLKNTGTAIATKIKVNLPWSVKALT